MSQTTLRRPGRLTQSFRPKPGPRSPVRHAGVDPAWAARHTPDRGWVNIRLNFAGRRGGRVIRRSMRHAGMRKMTSTDTRRRSRVSPACACDRDVRWVHDRRSRIDQRVGAGSQRSSRGGMAGAAWQSQQASCVPAVQVGSCCRLGAPRRRAQSRVVLVLGAVEVILIGSVHVPSFRQNSV